MKLGLILLSLSILGMAETPIDKFVPIPKDFEAHEIPPGSIVKFKGDLTLKAQTSDVTFKIKEGVTCVVAYAPDAQRRVVKTGTIFVITEEVKKVDTGAAETDGACFKDGVARKSYLATFKLRTESGFDMNMNCQHRQVWTTPSDQACTITTAPEVDDLSSDMEFFGDPQQLVKVIGP